MRFTAGRSGSRPRSSYVGQRPGPGQDSGCALHGRVVNSVSSAGVARVILNLTSVTGGASLETMSGSDGTFCFSNVPPGNYRLMASRHGYLKGAYGTLQPQETGKVLEVGANSGPGPLLLKRCPRCGERHWASVLSKVSKAQGDRT